MYSYFRGIVAFLGVVVLSVSAHAQTAVHPVVQDIPLFPDFDKFGSQFETVQTWDNGTGPRTAFSIYDTGASVVTLSANDQALFELLAPGNAIPIKAVGGASATAIGGSGTLTGDVSVPGAVRVAGISAFNIDMNDPANVGVDPNAGIQVPGIQMFVGTSTGSSVLPTITGTPIHNPGSTPGHEYGTAALVDMRSYQLDLEALLGDPAFHDIKLPLPDVSFLPRGQVLSPKADTFEPMKIPVMLAGEDNTANPGTQPSASFNPVVQQVRTTQGSLADENRNFLFDTGAQLSIISTETALALGLDLNAAPNSIDIQGASGSATIPGYVISSLELPRGDGGTLRFTDVPVFVLDIGEGIDGILGMNLFNGADQLLYDPYSPDGPHVSVTFLNDRSIDVDQDLAAAFPTLTSSLEQQVADLTQAYIQELESLGLSQAEIDQALVGFDANMAPLLTGFGSRFAVQGPLFIGVQPVPEPSAILLAGVAMVMFLRFCRKRSAGRV